MKLLLNKAHFPVTALGPGRRIGLWTQGCSIGCAGCISRDTWDPDPSTGIDVDELVAWCRRVAGDAPEGVTISGGEPFDQPEALGELLTQLHRWRDALDEPFDILCYSGYRIEQLLRRHSALLERIDALICDPYVEALPTQRVWRGSRNQRLFPLTPLGEARYGEVTRCDEDPGPMRFQAVADGSRIWFVGIPRRGDMERVAAACKARGVSFDSASWRA